MADTDTQPLSDEERAELEELRAEKARREAEEQARREREELAALRAEKAKAEASPQAKPQPKSQPASPAPQPKPQPKPQAAKPTRTARPAPRSQRAAAPGEPQSRDEMTFAQRMVTSTEPEHEGDIPGMAPAQKIIIVLALIAFAIFMGYTIMNRMGLLG